MVNFTLQDMERVMKNPKHVRNLSIIAHVDHGKSTLTDSLFAGAGAIRMDQAGNRRVTDGRKDEEARCITIKSTGISLLFPKTDYLPHETLLNVIDSPGHVDFSSEVTAALRATDGAIVVVDCVEGVCVQTETVLRQALQEMIQPVLVINKLDRFFLELKYQPEDIYQRLCRVIESVNVIIATYQSDKLKDFSIDPLKGNVAFAAGLMGWGFTLPQMADFYAKKTGNSADKIVKNLWGERFINSKTGKWMSKQRDNNWNRGFNELIIRPIQKVFECCMDEEIQWNNLNSLLPKINVELSKEQKETCKPKEIIKSILQQWIPAHICLLDIAINHLPSPKEAQKYRVDGLYTGDLDDSIAESIRNCDPEGPLIIYISKMAPERPDDRNSRFIAFGRIFSGTIKPGQKVHVLDSNYEYGKNSCFSQNISVNRVCVMIPKPTPVTQISAGNTVGLLGFDNYITKTATVCEEIPIHPIKNMSFSVAPVVQRAVEPAKPSEITKFVQALKQLSTSDSLVQCYQNESGEYIIAGAGELHLEICINDLQTFMGDSKIIVRDPVVTYCETIINTGKIYLVKSPNKHNRLFIRAIPNSNQLVDDIINDEFDVSSVKNSEMLKSLTSKYSWNSDDVKNLWGFFPFDGNKSSCFVNSTRGIAYVHEIRDSVNASLEWTCKTGPLIESEMYGVRFELTDAVLHSDSIHRGGGQIIPAGRKALNAAFLAASPRLMEPVYLVEISCPRVVVSACHQVLGKRRSSVLEEIPREGTDLVVLKAHLPVAESFGFSQDLRAATGGQAFPQMIFDHWQFVPGDPLENGSYANQIVKQIRERKGLSPNIPVPEDYEAILFNE